MIKNKLIPIVPTTLLFLFALATSSLVSSVRGQNLSTYNVLGIAVEGNHTADANFIKLSSGIGVGEEITGDDLQNAIKQLWELNMFSDIQILLDRETGDGLFLTIKVQEHPRLNKIELIGNDKVGKKDIEKKLSFYKNQMISQRDVARVKSDLKKMYEEKGYLLAQIEPEFEPVPDVDNRINLKVKIKEGNKVQIQKIRFHGNHAFDDGKLRKQMDETSEDGFFGGGDFDAEEYRKDIDLVLDFYRSEGFRDVEFVKDSISYGPLKKDMFIDIWVNEGKQYTIGDITWEGNELYPEAVLASQLGFSSGDVYSSKKLQEAVVEKLGGMYYDAGYIYATVNPIERPRSDSVVDLHFLVTEGKAVTINKIKIAGNTKTKEKVIRRELFIRPGDVFSREMLIRSQREVWVLNYFADVKPDVQPLNEDKVDILIEVEEKSTDTANMSAGWSERDKIIGSIGVAMNNLLGNGQKLAFDWNFGRSFRSFQLSFTEPWLLDSPTLVGVSLFDSKRSNRFGIGYGSRSQGGSIRLGRRLRWPDDFFRTDWIYRLQSVGFFDFSDAFRAANPNNIVTDFENGNQISSSITHIFSRNSLNRPEFPTAGSNVSLTSELAGGPLQGNVGYHKHVLSAKWFFPGFGPFVLHSSFEAGYLQGLENGSIVPYLEHFFMGGEGLSNSIALRGYDDPLRGGGVIVEGGRAMLKYLTELRFQISPNPTIFGLLFAEAGNTWPDLKQMNPYDLRRSVGIGARLFMPLLGVIGFDYAFGFDNFDPATGKRQGEWKPHFVFGRSF